MTDTYLLCDFRSLALHEAILVKIRQNPELLQIPLENIKRWKQQNKFPQPYLDEWLEHFSKGEDHLFKFMVEPSQEGQRLRSSSPFPGILTSTERMEIFERFKQYDERTVRTHYQISKHNFK